MTKQTESKAEFWNRIQKKYYTIDQQLEFIKQYNGSRRANEFANLLIKAREYVAKLDDKSK